MIDIECLRGYYAMDRVFITAHTVERFRQRGIRARDVRHAVHGGQIIEQYPDDYPYPSCLICGMTVEGRVIHVVMSDEGTMSRIITVYFPDVDKWNSDFTVRKERN
ncbi:DUF4258 domain-containing protein [uncultured Selenomonas sp.]|uniref:DUF4258 domain-containing protein n=1 Tax=uncultured Selenomonas sp. TaxID=159275 RepID=UPI0028D7F1E5|nr:DUF4258 domain-containing protein [uncultured Selenomonas sp.]